MGIKYHVNERFFDTWNTRMAYVLGFWFADGSIENAPAMRGSYVRITSTDREIIEAIKNVMQSEHTIVATKRPGKKTYYLLRIGNRSLFTAIRNRGVHERKSLTTSLPDVPDTYWKDFVRGYFDGDGCVYIERNQAGNPRRLTTVFTSGSKQFLTQLQHTLYVQAGLSKHLKIVTTKGGFSNAFQLRYSTGDSLQLYRFMYSKNVDKLQLIRKRNIFEQYYKNKGQVVKW